MKATASPTRNISASVVPAERAPGTQMKYSKLDCSKREIRLLRLDYGRPGEIRCRLADFSLDDKPVYKALSYAWTRAAATCLIYLNGMPHYVRPNLYAFFELMANEAHGYWIFIDALCIDQSDLQEKSGQVKLMGDIYRNAEEVITWTGIESQLADQMLHRRCAHEWQTICASENGIDKMFDGSYDEGEAYDKVTVFAKAFCSRKYWSRLWIVQEVALSRNVTIYVRSLRLRPKSLLHFIEKYYETYPPEMFEKIRTYINGTLEELAVVVGNTMMHNKSIWASSLLTLKVLTFRAELADDVRYPTLNRVFIMFSHQKCSILHDSVFGLLGLTTSRTTPDYDISVLELYIRVLIETIWQRNITCTIGEVRIATH